MTNRFHLFAHRQYAVPMAQAKGGMDNYISKPVRPEELLATLRAGMQSIFERTETNA